MPQVVPVQVDLPEPPLAFRREVLVAALPMTGLVWSKTRSARKRRHGLFAYLGDGKFRRIES